MSTQTVLDIQEYIRVDGGWYSYEAWKNGYRDGPVYDSRYSWNMSFQHLVPDWREWKRGSIFMINQDHNLPMSKWEVKVLGERIDG